MDGLIVKGVGRTDAIVPALPANDPRQEAFERALQTQVGKSMPVAVLSKFGDGSFLVRVAGNHARMQLPPGAQAGTDVPMTLVATSPRPTFQLENGHAAHAVLVQLAPGSAQAAGKAAALHSAAALGASAAPAGGAADAADDGATASLSTAGRIITRLLDIAGPAGHITSATPLQTAAPAGGAELAPLLRDAIGRSGLFYESHVAEWSEGKRTLPDLLREPQMAAPRPGSPETDPATAQLVSQQLVLHEQARMAWQGQVWPGQDMQWEIHRDAPEGGKSGREDDPVPAWRSGLRLRFPQLGDIAATVVVSGGQLHIQLTTGTAGAGALLRAHAGELAAALGAAGSPLSSLDIRPAHGGQDD